MCPEVRHHVIADLTVPGIQVNYLHMSILLLTFKARIDKVHPCHRDPMPGLVNFLWSNRTPSRREPSDIIENMPSKFAHPALSVQKDKPLVYTAMSKHLFYYRMFISIFVLENGGVPLNPFMVFDYFLLDAVDRDLVREGNNNLVKRCDEVWVFGAVSNGVLAEIQIANEQDKPIRYFDIQKPHRIVEITKEKADMEAEVADMRHLL